MSSRAAKAGAPASGPPARRRWSRSSTKAGGGYKSGPSAKQKSLKRWTKQEWRTPSGKPSVQGPKATGEVYAPKRAIEKLRSSPGGMQKLAAATRAKREATGKGEQFARHGLNKGRNR